MLHTLDILSDVGWWGVMKNRIKFLCVTKKGVDVKFPLFKWNCMKCRYQSKRIPYRISYQYIRYHLPLFPALNENIFYIQRKRRMRACLGGWMFNKQFFYVLRATREEENTKLLLMRLSLAKNIHFLYKGRKICVGDTIQYFLLIFHCWCSSLLIDWWIFSLSFLYLITFLFHSFFY